MTRSPGSEIPEVQEAGTKDELFRGSPPRFSSEEIGNVRDARAGDPVVVGTPGDYEIAVKSDHHATPAFLWSEDGPRSKSRNAQADILLVENDGDDVELAREALEETNRAFKLHVVRDGAQALEFLRPQAQHSNGVRPDLILLDLHMPRMGGLEFLTNIKGDASLRMIPVIMLTSSREESDITETFNRGANSYIVKPRLFAELCRVMQVLLAFWFDIATRPPKSGEFIH